MCRTLLPDSGEEGGCNDKATQPSQRAEGGKENQNFVRTDHLVWTLVEQ